MRKFNFSRALLILAVAFLANSLTTTICLALGTSKESASNIAFLVMMAAVLIAYIRMNKNRHRK